MATDRVAGETQPRQMKLDSQLLGDQRSVSKTEELIRGLDLLQHHT
jgi:hypothetical protein